MCISSMMLRNLDIFFPRVVVSVDYNFSTSLGNLRDFMHMEQAHDDGVQY
ncbi:hypothetical protein Hanom_Chr16g01441121 [Helianthus anomalus]